MRKPLRTSLLISASVHLAALASIAFLPGLKESHPDAPKTIATLELVAASPMNESKSEPKTQTKPATPKVIVAPKPPEPVKQPEPLKPELPKPVPVQLVKVEEKIVPKPHATIPIAAEPVSVPTKQTSPAVHVAVAVVPATAPVGTLEQGDGSSAVPGHDAITSDARPGDIIQAQPSYRSNPEPAYPASARRRHETGVVVLSVSVSARGRALNVKVKSSSGYPALDNAALVAVRDWEFEPARVNNQPIASEVEVPVRFRLEK